MATIAGLGFVAAPCAQDDSDRGPVLPPGCEALQVPAGNEVSFHAYAVGFQIYRWNSSTNAWVFVAPAAVLYSSPHLRHQVGTHFAGPTWQSNSGSSVLGARLLGATPDPTAIPWLLLRAVSSAGPGIFAGTTFVQRVNTVGGLAPARAGAFDGEEVGVPYTAQYYFYRADD
jgi:hypothetical protein